MTDKQEQPQTPVEKLAGSLRMKADFVRAAELTDEQISTMQAKLDRVNKISKYVTAPSLLITFGACAWNFIGHGTNYDAYSHVAQNIAYGAIGVFIASTMSKTESKIHRKVSDLADKNMLKAYNQTLDI